MILSITNLILLLVVDNPSLGTVLGVINAIMFPIFLGDFFYRFFTAPDRAAYFFCHFGWADLLSSLPFQQVRIFRVFRIWRVVRLFMEFGAHNLVHEFMSHRAENALLTVGFLVLCVLEFGSLAVLKAESASPNFLANMFLTPPKPKEEEPPVTGAGTPKAKLAQLKQMIKTCLCLSPLQLSLPL